MLEFLKPLLFGGSLMLAATSAGALQVGDMAPDFALPGTDDKTYRLSDYRGKQAVVLAWFPKAYTSGCTIECKSLTEKGHLIQEFDTTYFMASVDPLADNKGFAMETGADFPLLSDTDKSVAEAYDVLHPQGFARRQTFYIGTDGRILKIDADIQPETSAEDIAATLDELGVERR
ncbi:MAG TPA: peroxiredoxin [Burkholderiaceae bacterium]|nr:peroxiredoxin [Burkholderiaceae bacterium]